MTIGIPRALLYHRYKDLWEAFFAELNCKIVVSEETNKKILDYGIKHSIDESCLPVKIYMGHIYSLIGKCNYILVPRIASYYNKNMVCVKFNALYDIVKNTFEKDVKLIDYNIDAENGKSEQKGFIKMGRMLGNSYIKSLLAYKKAKKVLQFKEKQKNNLQAEKLKENDKLKILVVSHHYNTYDKLIGYPIVEYIKKLGGTVVFADSFDKEKSIKKSKEISKSLYWIYNKELVGSIKLLEDSVDGIILLTAFPCGPDSLVNELIIRKFKKTPIINIIQDELFGEAGMQTRIESFMDIIYERKRKMDLCQGL